MPGMSRWIVGFILLFAGIASCQTVRRSIFVAEGSCGTDSVGLKVTFALKEMIRGSKGYMLAAVGGKKADFFISLACLDPTESPKGLSTVISSAILSGDLLYHSMAVVGLDNVDREAKSILANLDVKFPQ
jgi:hypothetical protein